MAFNVLTDITVVRGRPFNSQGGARVILKTNKFVLIFSEKNKMIWIFSEKNKFVLIFSEKNKIICYLAHIYVC